jgi:hypothetical protein
MSTSAENFHNLITRLQVVLSEIDYAQKAACKQGGWSVNFSITSIWSKPCQHE